MQKSLKLPTQACAYEHYDAITLEPLNNSTYVRLIELGWTSADFKDNSVLDIGCNTGSLSLYAHNLGANRITAVDVQDPLVSFFTEVVKDKKLPIDVRKSSFDDLDVLEDRADVVLFMEVLHWIVDQGGTVADCIAKLASLTKKTLFLETPWDIDEPSIARKGIVKHEDYNIELILRELSRHFKDVQINRFMTYFGNMKNSKRVLITARNPRDIIIPAGRSKDINLLDVKITRATNNVELVTSKDGPSVLKKLPNNSVFKKGAPSLVREICKFLMDVKNPVFVPPTELNEDCRLVQGADTFMLFPFVGSLGSYFPNVKAPTSVDAVMPAVIELRNQLSEAPNEIVELVRASSPPIGAVGPKEIPELPFTLKREHRAKWEASFERMKSYDRKKENALVHFDLQGGNILNDGDTVRIVDLDLLRTGTGFSDALSAAIFNGCVLTSSEIEALSDINGRPLEQFDVDFAVMHVFGWLRSILQTEAGPSNRQIEKFATGLAGVFDIAV